MHPPDHEVYLYDLGAEMLAIVNQVRQTITKDSPHEVVETAFLVLVDFALQLEQTTGMMNQELYWPVGEPPLLPGITDGLGEIAPILKKGGLRKKNRDLMGAVEWLYRELQLEGAFEARRVLWPDVPYVSKEPEYC
jgi:hypothetical protein